MYKLLFKRVIDFLVTFIGFIMISPIFLFLCLLVRIKLGSPVFFKQVRITKGEKPFRILKFRTMLDARDDNGILLPDEERFTKFGNFMRDTSLDELPELLNVLIGDMSLVGPRPLYPDYLPYYTKEESLRHTVRSGITGLAQINGRNLLNWNSRFEYDCNYIKNISLLNDVKILWYTFLKVVNQADIGQPSVEEELPLNQSRPVLQSEKIKLLEQINQKYGKTDTYINDSKEIGGDFSISAEQLDEVANLSTHMDDITRQYLSTCRSVISEILDEIKSPNQKMVAFVPSFTCHVCIEPFVEMGYEVYPYKINKDLSINWHVFLTEVEKKKPSVILIHSFFGLNTLKGNEEVINEINELGICIIEDLTHSMFSNFSHLDVSYHIGSIRKWLPIPDGAFVKGLKKQLYLIQDNELVNAKIEAMKMKNDYLMYLYGDNVGYRKSFAHAEELLDSRKQAFRMSDESVRICKSVDWDKFKSVRRQNYNKLCEMISECQDIQLVIGKCDDTEVPLMVPIYVPNDRASFQSYMVKNNIFPTIIWRCSEYIKSTIDSDAKYIYDNIICFHCDQRYTVKDMERIGNTIYNFYTNN